VTHRGPCRPPTFCDSVRGAGPSARPQCHDGQRGSCEPGAGRQVPCFAVPLIARGRCQGPVPPHPKLCSRPTAPSPTWTTSSSPREPRPRGLRGRARGAVRPDRGYSGHFAAHFHLVPWKQPSSSAHPEKAPQQPPTATEPTGTPCPGPLIPSLKLKPPAS